MKRIWYIWSKRCMFFMILMLVMAYIFFPLYTKQAAYFLWPSQFGKTHFIVGFPHDQISRETSEKAESTTAVFFGPNQEILKRLLQLIDHEQESLWIATFLLTDKHIAQACIAAKRRGVDVQLIIDPTGIQDRFNKVSLLVKAGIPVFIYNPPHQKKIFVSRMHNKFIVFAKNENNRSCVWTGSSNMTKSSYTRNKENVIILYDSLVTDAFRNEFHTIKQTSVPLADYHEQNKKL